MAFRGASILTLNLAKTLTLVVRAVLAKSLFPKDVLDEDQEEGEACHTHQDLGEGAVDEAHVVLDHGSLRKLSTRRNNNCLTGRPSILVDTAQPAAKMAAACPPCLCHSGVNVVAAVSTRVCILAAATPWYDLSRSRTPR